MMWRLAALGLALAFVQIAKAEIMTIAPILKENISLQGGWYDIDLSNPGDQRALDFAVAKFNKRINCACVYEVKRVIRAGKQVVNGFNYRFTVEMEKTDEEALVDISDATDAGVTPQVTQCTFRVYEKHSGPLQLFGMSCQK